MGEIILGLMCLTIGVFLGIMITALCVVSGREDERNGYK